MFKYTDVYIKDMKAPISLNCSCDDVHRLIGEAAVAKKKMVELTATLSVKIENIEAVVPMGIVYTGR